MTNFRHDLSFTGFVRKPGVADVSGTKTPRPRDANYFCSSTVAQDGVAELYK